MTCAGACLHDVMMCDVSTMIDVFLLYKGTTLYMHSIATCTHNSTSNCRIRRRHRAGGGLEDVHPVLHH